MSTWLGIFAIVVWSTSVAFSRSLTEQLGTLNAAAWIYLSAGFLGTSHWAIQRKRNGKSPPLSKKYWFGCGFLFVLYSLCLYLAIGLAANRQQVIEVGLINYLWPALTLVFSIPILKKKARWFLAPGVLLALGGIVLATAQQSGLSWTSFTENIRANATPYLIALTAAVSWGLYSNLAKHWGGGGKGGGVPFFLLATGVVLAVLMLVFPEKSNWTPRAMIELAYMSIFPGLLAYVCWERAMRRGNMPLVASLSNFTPLISTIVSCVYLDVDMGLMILIACVLVVLGAFLCKKAIPDEKEAA